MRSILRSFALAVCHLLILSIAVSAQTDELVFRQLTSAVSAIGVTVRGASYDGKRIVFESLNDYTGENTDNNNEIFVYDVDSRTFIQITKTTNILDPEDMTKVVLAISNNTPVISGDGEHIVFTSNAKLTESDNEDGNQEIYLATLPRNSTTPTITRITNTGKNTDDEEIAGVFNNYQPAINADGTVIAFVSTRRVFGALENGTPEFTVSLEGPNRDLPPDGNGEIFLYNVVSKTYQQVTISRDEEATDGFTVKGFNATPQLSGNGQLLAFVSGFNYPGPNANQNPDFNGEIFLYKPGDPANSFRQLTNTTGFAAIPPGSPVNVLASFTRALDFEGTKLVFESSGNFANSNADQTREIFLVDLAGEEPAFRQITNQATADLATSDFSFLPSINANGTFITFNSTLNLVPTNPSNVTTDNADGSKEVFRYDIAASTPMAPVFRQLTFTQPVVFPEDQRFNTTFSFANETGDRFVYHYLGNRIAQNLNATPEIFEELILPVTMDNMQEATLANAASFDATQVARGSVAAVFGTQLANTTASTPTINLPYELEGVRVTVNGLAAQLLFVSPEQINFIVPPGIAEGEMISFSINNNGVRSTGMAKIVSAAPGVFTVSTTGTGPAAAQCGALIDVMMDDMTTQEFVISEPPCSVGTAERANYLILYGTGWRNQPMLTTVTIDDQVITPVFVGAQGTFPGLDQINLTLPMSLMGKGAVNVTVTANSVASKVVTIEIQ